MFEDYNICPYTGLRSFTEEESIYFKGRDIHILEATAQLQRNRFLMVTGASGDGKSSIVYAGIVPNARAGFLKSTYTNWQIADFRPERSPFSNLCQSLDKALGINNINTVNSELQHGFSALVDLYKSSSCYIDTTSNEYKNSSEDDRKKMSLTSANLLIIVDQFEEFFTNPENYVNGAPSNSATLTMNLLLETAKIAQDEGLPIYVVFTMRSDYIGQCAAFRELPEFIGFSQFFVPRLNRKLLQEVIEEPCVLSGNRISRRLTERIIQDMNDGVDQLPILQHALNQIWKAADDGKEEMDLIHYAKVGGMHPSDLTDEDQVTFNNWFNELPEKIQLCFQERSLHNVLNTHANKIYESAASYYHEKSGKTVSEDVAHAIIKVAFTSLTKIDQSREVRNRMSLGEIRDILNRPGVEIETIAGILNLFREPGNTFIRPFILEDHEPEPLTEDTVLDITHESLIRNWSLLKIWAKEEYDKFVVFKDFKQQVDRWLEYNKSSGFLLPIGSLTFFENWYSDSDINKYWVNRYNEQVTDTPKNINESSSIFNACNEFLDRSAKKHLVTKAIVKFGPRRISLIIAALLVLFLSSLLYSNYRKRTSEYVLNKVQEDAIKLLNGDKAPYNAKASYLINSERIEDGQFNEILNAIDAEQNKLNITIAAAEYLNTYDRHGVIQLKKESILAAESIATRLYSAIPSDQTIQSAALSELIDLAELCEYYTYLYKDEDIIKAQANINAILSRLTLHLFQNPFADINNKKLIEGFEMSLNHKKYTIEELELILSVLRNPESAIQANFAKNKFVTIGGGGESLTYGGKYQILANLYASLNKVDECLMAIDKILEDRPRYPSFMTDGNTVAGYFMQYGHWESVDKYVVGYGEKIGYKPFEIYRQIASRAGIATQAIHERNQYNTWGNNNNTYNSILDYMSDASFHKLYQLYYNAVFSSTSSGNEQNYYLAIYFKQKGIFTAKRNQDKRRPAGDWVDGVRNDFKQALYHYKLVSEAYKNEEITAFFHIPTELTRKQIFYYPDYIEESPSQSPRTRYTNYLTAEFLLYLIDNNLMEDVYTSGSDLQYVATWVSEYKNTKYIAAYNYQSNKLKFEILQKIDSALVNHSNSNFVNKTMLMLLLADEAFKNTDDDLGIAYTQRINYVSLPSLFNEDFFGSHIKTINLISEIYGFLALNNQIQLGQNIFNAFSDIRNQVSLLDHAASVLYTEGLDSLGNIYYDSAEIIIATRTEMTNRNRKAHSYATAIRGREGDLKLSGEIIRNLGGFLHNSALSMNVRAAAHRGYYFDAYSSVPQFSSSEEHLNILNQILLANVYYKKDSVWNGYDSKKEYINELLWYF